jgi:hypothetical protein
MNQGLYHPLHVPTRPWEIISKYFVGGIPTTRKGHGCLYVVLDRFNNMCILMPCKNTINGKEETNKFFEQVWVHFGIPESIISDRYTKFISAFWTTLWEKMDTKLKRSTTFHPQTNGQTEVVNRTFVYLLRGYNQKNLRTWDENLIYKQHSYNKTFHTSTSKSPFETFFGYFPPSPLDFVYGKQGGVREDLTGDALKEKKIIEKIRHIHLQV